ncbi:hypothetical protein DL93DRAFT_2099954 [Clavulina sp. PMI_390]|nr:hypothetical protein DL93DRAFT_2099954 [Clavulina sp. PMI_390]
MPQARQKDKQKFDIWFINNRRKLKQLLPQLECSIASMISRLPRETQMLLRSTVVVSSLSQIVSELVQNSLDAGATHIDIGLDPSEWTCWVRDDGCGIEMEDLQFIGGEDDSGRSSKYPHTSSTATFGFRGEEIVSRTTQRNQNWSIIVKNSKLLYSGPALRWLREKHGTTVCVRDAFYNLPVRRSSHSKESQTIDSVTKIIQTFALVSPATSFGLNLSSRRAGGDDDRLRVLTIPKDVDLVDVSDANARTHGFISKRGTSDLSSATLILKQEGTDARTDLLGPSRDSVTFQDPHQITRMLIRVVREFLTQNGFLRSSETRPHSIPGHFRGHRRNSKSTRRRIDQASSAQEPALNSSTSSLVNIPPSDNMSIVDGNWVGRDPRTRRNYAFNAQGGSSSGPSGFSPPSQPHEWLPGVVAPHRYIDRSRLLNGAHSVNLEREKNRNDSESFPPSTQFPGWIIDMVDEENQTFVPSIDDPVPQATFNPPALPGKQEADFLMRQPSHQQQARPPLVSNPPVSQAPFSRTPTSLASIRTLSGFSSSNISSTSFSRDDLASAEVLGQVDSKYIACVIHRLQSVHPSRSALIVLIDQHAADERIRVEQFLRDLCIGFLRNNISRCPPSQPNLSHLESTSSTLGVIILLSTTEAKLLCALPTRSIFDRWGFTFSEIQIPRVIDPPAPEAQFTQATVLTIPALLFEKLDTPAKLQETIKNLLAEIATEPHLAGPFPSSEESNTTTTDVENLWMDVIRFFPQELLILINSKACRGAIMFNDRLELIFPFQCAHGRPSLVPLTNLASNSTSPSQSIDWAAFDEAFL